MAGRSREVKLVMRVVDMVSGPARAVAGSLKLVDNAVRGVSNISRGFGAAAMGPTRAMGAMGRAARRSVNDVASLSAGMGYGISKMARDVYDMEKQLNIAQAAGNISLEQRMELMRRAAALNEDYAATSAEIVAGGNELLKSGMTFEQMMGSLPGILNAAQAMDEPIAEASAAIVQAMVSQKMAMEDRDKAMASSIKMADLYAHAINETAGANLEDFRTSGKYFNSVASAIGMSVEQTMAWQVALAKAGIYGSSAGTGLRAAPVAMAAPTKAGREALGRLGIDPAQFVGRRTSNATGDSIAGALEAGGYLTAGTDGIEAQIDQIIKSGRFNDSTAKLANAILESISDNLDPTTSGDRSQISQAIQTAIDAGISEVNMLGFLTALRDKGAGIGDYKAVFGQNHASKMMAIDIENFQTWLDELIKGSPGTAERMRTAMMAGIVGDVNELTAAIEKLSVAIGQSGLLSDASKVMTRFSEFTDQLAESNPDLLRFGSYATLALVALAPLGLALSGAAAALAIMVNPLALVAGSLAVLAGANLSTIADFFRVFGSSFRSGITPETAASIERVFGSLKGFFTGGISEASADMLGQVARDLGLLAAAGVNGLNQVGPTLSAMADGMRAFGTGLMAAGQQVWTQLLPQIAPGIQSMKEAFAGFIMPKVEGFLDLGRALADFVERARPFFEPTLAPAITLIGDSFNTMAAGARAVANVIGGVTEGIYAFATGFLEGIDTAALQAVGTSLSRFFTDLSEGLRPLQNLFNSINVDFAEFARLAGTVVGEAVSSAIGFIQTLMTSPSDLGAWTGPIIAGVQAVIEILNQVAGAVQTAIAAIDQLTAKGSLPGHFGSTAVGNGQAHANPYQPFMPGDTPTVGGPPKKAAGGAARAGLTYLTGERGPELITMGRNGYVTPNHRMGGGGNTYNITVNAPTREGKDIAAALRARLNLSHRSSINGRPYA